MKAMILVDMPDDAKLDEWYAVTVVVDRLIATEEELMKGIPFDESKVFKFVPLRPLPQKKEVEVNKIDDYMHTEFSVDKLSAKILLDTDKLIALGWNACLKEITGEKE